MLLIADNLVTNSFILNIEFIDVFTISTCLCSLCLASLHGGDGGDPSLYLPDLRHDRQNPSVHRDPSLPLLQICGVTDKTLSFSETYRNVLRLSEALHRRGYRHGDVIATAMPNCLEMPALVFACAARGIITTTMNPLYTEGELRSLWVARWVLPGRR